MPTRLDTPPHERQHLLRQGRCASSGQLSTRNERIMRSCTLLCQSPKALDILCTSLSRLSGQPTNEKFRKVNVQTGVFAERVANCPGATELLLAIGYEPLHGHLVLQKYDDCFVRSALVALEGAKQTIEYQNAKTKDAIETARQSASAHDNAVRLAQRAAALAKVPEEPQAGDATSSACQISIHAHGERIARRRFESDNTLEDVVNFVRSLASAPPEPFVLENITTRPPRVLDQRVYGACSLYSLDLWPVGHVKVAVKPATA